MAQHTIQFFAWPMRCLQRCSFCSKSRANSPGPSERMSELLVIARLFVCWTTNLFLQKPKLVFIEQNNSMKLLARYKAIQSLFTCRKINIRRKINILWFILVMLKFKFLLLYYDSKTFCKFTSVLIDCTVKWCKVKLILIEAVQSSQIITLV